MHSTPPRAQQHAFRTPQGPLAAGKLDTSDEEEEDISPDFARNRRANDARLKDRFEAIFEKYGRDFDGIGDEIDLETGEIVVNNGHLENMQDDIDAGNGGSIPLQIAHAFAEDLPSEPQSSSYESGTDELGSQGGPETTSDPRDILEEVDDSVVGTQEQDKMSDIPSAESDKVSRLAHLASQARSEHALNTSVKGDGQDSRADQFPPQYRKDFRDRMFTTFRSEPIGLDLARPPEILLAIDPSRPIDISAIAALQRCIDDHFPSLRRSTDTQGRQQQKKKRKDTAWDYPELPKDKRRRSERIDATWECSPLLVRESGRPDTSLEPSSPRLKGFRPAMSPVPQSKMNRKKRSRPDASLWAPVDQPEPRRKTRALPSPPEALFAPGSKAAAATTEHEDSGADKPKCCSNCRDVVTRLRKDADGNDICNACHIYLYRYDAKRPSRFDQLESASELSSDPRPKQGVRHARFTCEEDTMIIKLKEIDNLSWQGVGQHLVGRSQHAVQFRYAKKLMGNSHPEAIRARAALKDQGFDTVQLERDRNGGFLKEEDELLLQLCHVMPPEKDIWHSAVVKSGIDHAVHQPDTSLDHNPDFYAIAAEHFPRFTPQELRDRYFHHLERDEEVKHSKVKKKANIKADEDGRRPSDALKHKTAGMPFSQQENERLVQHREVDPIPWPAVAQKFPERTLSSIQKRYTRELARRKAIVSKGGEDPYSHLFITRRLSAIDHDVAVQGSRKSVLNAMESRQCSRVGNGTISTYRQEQKPGQSSINLVPGMEAHTAQMPGEHLPARAARQCAPAAFHGSSEQLSDGPAATSSAIKVRNGRMLIKRHDTNGVERSDASQGQLPQLSRSRTVTSTTKFGAKGKLNPELYHTIARSICQSQSARKHDDVVLSHHDSEPPIAATSGAASGADAVREGPYPVSEMSTSLTGSHENTEASAVNDIAAAANDGRPTVLNPLSKRNTMASESSGRMAQSAVVQSKKQRPSLHRARRSMSDAKVAKDTSNLTSSSTLRTDELQDDSDHHKVRGKGSCVRARTQCPDQGGITSQQHDPHCLSSHARFQGPGLAPGWLSPDTHLAYPTPTKYKEQSGPYYLAPGAFSMVPSVICTSQSMSTR